MRQTNRAIVGLCLALGVSVVVVFALLRRGRIPLYFDEERTRISILEHIPIGTDSGQAKRQMERTGFLCEVYDNLNMQGYPPTALYCGKPSRDIRAPMASWRVSLFLVRGSVSDVLVIFGSP